MIMPQIFCGRRKRTRGARNVGSKPVIMTARESVQASETARLLAMKRQDDERIAREKQEAADREAAARAQADESARQKAVADAQAAEAARQAAESARQAEAEGRRAAEEKAAAAGSSSQRRGRALESGTGQAVRSRTTAPGRTGPPNAAASRAESPGGRAAQDAGRTGPAATAAAIAAQFNLILETRDTARGLIVNMSDVLFDFNKYTLQTGRSRKAGQDLRDHSFASRPKTGSGRLYRQHRKRRLQYEAVRTTRRRGARLSDRSRALRPTT